jgi:hypothetical protein
MAIKNALLGGADFSTPDDRIKPTDLNDTFDATAGFLTWCASNFNDLAQNIFNADYLGFDSRLNNTGSPEYKNLFYSTFTSQDADTVINMEYDATNDLYQTFDPSAFGTNYVIIEADDANPTWTNNNTQLDKIGTGRWVLYGTSGTDEVIRANIHKSLWYGTDGTNQLIDDFTNVTALETTIARDVGKQAFYAKTSGSAANGSTYTGTFANTSTNSDCSSWSNVVGGSSEGVAWELPEATILNQATNSSSNEIGTDTTADETNNPADCQLQKISGGGTTGVGNVIIVCVGDITWVNSGWAAATNRDFFTDDSIPLFTAATDDFLTSTMIFKDTVPSTDNAIAIISSSIDASSSEVRSLSADGGSNYTTFNNAEIVRPTAGTALWRKIEITRTDDTKIDKVTEQIVKHSVI